MQTFYGTKLLAARPMTRQEYLDYRGWDLPNNENADDTGYLVEYLDGGAANDPRHGGYISWSPQDVFDAAYTPTNAMSFSHALVALKAGARLTRKGWNGAGMFVFLVDGSTFTVNREPLLSLLGAGVQVEYRPHIDIKQVNGSIGVWHPSMGDVMAEDWYTL